MVWFRVPDEEILSRCSQPASFKLGSDRGSRHDHQWALTERESEKKGFQHSTMPLDGATPPPGSQPGSVSSGPGPLPLCWGRYSACMLHWWASEDLECRDGSFATSVPCCTVPYRPFCSPPTFSEPPGTGTHTRKEANGSALDTSQCGLEKTTLVSRGLRAPWPQVSQLLPRG